MAKVECNYCHDMFIEIYAGQRYCPGKSCQKLADRERQKNLYQETKNNTRTCRRCLKTYDTYMQGRRYCKKCRDFIQKK